MTPARLLLVLLLMAGVSGVYFIKYKVAILDEEISSMRREISEEQENIHVLQAEWTYLTRPQRIKQLSKKYLGEDYKHPKVVADLGDVPYPGAEVAPVATLPVVPSAYHVAGPGM